MPTGDIDGQGGIVPLLINFFSHWPSLFEKGKICVIPSPRYVIAKNRKKSKERIYCYTQEEYEAIRDKYKGYEIRYIKGLGSLDSVEYADVLNHEERWIQVELDDLSCLDTMFSSFSSSSRNSRRRKSLSDEKNWINTSLKILLKMILILMYHLMQVFMEFKMVILVII